MTGADFADAGGSICDVLPSVFGSRRYFQVLQAIVVLVVVDVMDYFARQQWSAQVFGHDESMHVFVRRTRPAPRTYVTHEVAVALDHPQHPLDAAHGRVPALAYNSAAQASCTASGASLACL